MTTRPVTVALAGDTMLGRGVAEAVERRGPTSLFAPEIGEITRGADLFVANLECCISERGHPWPGPGKPFFFRAPPAAVEALVDLGVTGVSLANNHALDFGPVALADTLEHLAAAGIAVVGAGDDVVDARRPVVLSAGDWDLAVVALTDHPSDFAAAPTTPGVAYADLREGVPPWVHTTIGEAADHASAVLVTPHWGPNMTTEPRDHVRRIGRRLVDTGTSLVAGHSAHVFHGVERRILWDLGDFVDDYRVDPDLRNDLGLLWLVTFEGARPASLEAIPLALDFCHTRLADADEAAWIARRFEAACRSMGTEVSSDGGRLRARLT